MPDWARPLLDYGVLGIFVAVGMLALSIVAWDAWVSIIKPGMKAYIETVQKVGACQMEQASCLSKQTDLQAQMNEKQDKIVDLLQENRRVCENRRA